jgi:hypothetical protein
MRLTPTVDGKEWTPANITHYVVTPRSDSKLEVRATLTKHNPNLSENMRGGEVAFITGPHETGDQVVIMDGAYKVFDSRTHLKEFT